MKKIFVVFLLLSSAFGADKRLPQGQADNELVTITAMIIPPEQVRQEFGSRLDGNFTVLEVHVSPKGDKPYDVQLDDFVLRAESDGEHSGPLAASQIIDTGALVIKQTYAPRSNAQMPQMIGGTKVEMKDDLGQNHADESQDTMDALKKRILAEKAISETESGLLFFPLDKKRPKSLVLSCTTPSGKLRIQFK